MRALGKLKGKRVITPLLPPAPVPSRIPKRYPQSQLIPRPIFGGAI